TGVQTCALPIFASAISGRRARSTARRRERSSRRWSRPGFVLCQASRRRARVGPSAARGVSSVAGSMPRSVVGARARGPTMAPMTSCLRPYRGRLPQLGERVFIDPSAQVIGDVVLGDDVSIWPMTVVRGDVNFIRIGARSNIQDGVVIHVSHDGPHLKDGGFATVIGEDVTIGHRAIIHACRIEDACLIGMGAVVMDGAVVRKHGFVGANALVSPGKEVGEGGRWLGNPARLVRKLDDAQIEGLYYSAQHYVRLKDDYLLDAASL